MLFNRINSEVKIVAITYIKIHLTFPFLIENMTHFISFFFLFSCQEEKNIEWLHDMQENIVEN